MATGVLISKRNYQLGELPLFNMYVTLRPAAWTSPGNWFKMQFLRLCPDLMNQHLPFLKMQGDFHTNESLSCLELRLSLCMDKLSKMNCKPLIRYFASASFLRVLAVLTEVYERKIDISFGFGFSICLISIPKFRFQISCSCREFQAANDKASGTFFSRQLVFSVLINLQFADSIEYLQTAGDYGGIIVFAVFGWHLFL